MTAKPARSKTDESVNKEMKHKHLLNRRRDYFLTEVERGVEAADVQSEDTEGRRLHPHLNQEVEKTSHS